MRNFFLILTLIAPILQLSAREDLLILEESTPFKARNWSIVSAYYSQEREYENDVEVLDQKNDEALFLELTKGFILSEKLSLEIALNFEVFGKSHHTFSSSLNRAEASYHYRGPRAFRTRLIYTYQSTAKRQQAILLEVMGMPGTSEDGQALLGGVDGGFSHVSRWYHPNHFFTQTHLKVVFLGKKRIKKQNGELETVDPYSILEFLASVGYQKTKWLFALTPGFGLTTDYNIRRASYSRLSDKGFTLHLRAALGYQFKEANLTLSHTLRSHVFNNITDQSSQEIDFEIESGMTSLEYIWSF